MLLERAQAVTRLQYLSNPFSSYYETKTMQQTEMQQTEIHQVLLIKDATVTDKRRQRGHKQLLTMEHQVIK